MALLNPRRIAAVLFAALAPVLAGCGILDSDPWREREEALEANRARWASHDVSDYTLGFSLSSEMATGRVQGPFRVTVVVEDDSIVSASLVTSGEPLAEEHWVVLSTVEDLFDAVAQAIDERAEAYEVEYDPRYGYPTLISVDYSRAYVDDEYLIHAWDLEPS